MGKKIAFGLGVVVLLAAVGITAGWVARSRTSKAPPGTWNSNAIAGSFAAIHVRESDPSNASIVFLYDLDNRSGSDYTLSAGPGLIVMGRLKSTGSLSPENQYHLASAVFLPAGNRTRVTIETTEPFRWPAQMDAASEAQFRQMVSRSISDLGGFVLFDPATHYQIELPGSWPQTAEGASVLSN
jgi:hypothetical protein